MNLSGAHLQIACTCDLINHMIYSFQQATTVLWWKYITILSVRYRKCVEGLTWQGFIEYHFKNWTLWNWTKFTLTYFIPLQRIPVKARGVHIQTYLIHIWSVFANCKPNENRQHNHCLRIHKYLVNKAPASNLWYNYLFFQLFLNFWHFTQFCRPTLLRAHLHHHILSAACCATCTNSWRVICKIA